MTYRQTDRPHGRTDGQWETDRQTDILADGQTDTDRRQTNWWTGRQTDQTEIDKLSNSLTNWPIGTKNSTEKLIPNSTQYAEIPLRFPYLETLEKWKSRHRWSNFPNKTCDRPKKPNEEHMLRYNQRVFSENLAPWPVEVNLDIFLFPRRNNSSFRSQSDDSTRL